MISNKQENDFFILIRSAHGLKSSDLSGKSDPYVLCRLGKIGSNWQDKPQSTERCSLCINSTLNPEWNFIAKYHTICDNIDKMELHIKIMDNDMMNADDFLGDVQISLHNLFSHYDEATEYDICNGTGKIVIMVGKQIQNNINNIEQKYLPLWLQSIQQSIESMDDTIVYTVTMAQFLLAGIKSDTGLRDWFYKKGDCEGIWNGPEDKNCITYMKHKDVIDRLKTLPEKFGTNNVNGSVERQNNLGFQKLNNVIWSELKNPVIGLAQDQETHAFVRKYISQVLGDNRDIKNGGWTIKMIQKYSMDFFDSRNSFNTSDYKIWTTIVLHKIHFNMDLSWNEAIEFMEMQRILLISIAPSEQLLSNPFVQSIIGLDKAIKYKREMLVKYIDALSNIFPEDIKKMNPEKLVILASNFMDSLLFAGGQSVPTVLTYCTTLLYSKWLHDRLPNFILDDTNIKTYVMEVIRYFPPVSGFVYRERSFGYEDSKAIYLSLHMAQCDKDEWGDDAHEFILRPLKTYEKLMVAWANGSVGQGKYEMNSRECPGKDLSIIMITEMLKSFVKNNHTGQKINWIPDKNPKEINVNGYNITEIILTKNRTGILTDDQIGKLWYNKSDTKFDNMDGFTKFFISVVKATIDPSRQEDAKNVDTIEEKHKYDNDCICKFGNLRLINHDEEDINKDAGLINFIKAIGFSLVNTFKFEDKLEWFDSVEEGILTMEKELLLNLPYQYNYWTDITSDNAISDICFNGIGQYYISLTNSNGYIVDLTHLGKYETRPKFSHYGHSAYFNSERKLTGIFSCYDNKMIYPNQSEWESAKFGFKSSLITDMTLRIHLCYIHFIISNSMMISAKETLSKTNPLRRLLKPHYHRSSVINWSAKEILVPENQLAHRTWAFTESSWNQLFRDVFKGWHYETFRKKYDSLPEKLKELNYYADGILLWECIYNYVNNYIDKMYNTYGTFKIHEIHEIELELREFWNHINSQINYGLPEFSKHELKEYITDTIWWCTGGHEMAGSIVEYLESPQGCMPKVVKGKDIADVQTYAQALIIISLTGLCQPKLMDDWSHIFTNSEFSQINKSFQENLYEVSNIIKSRNSELHNGKKRILYRVMDPGILESSVSI